MRIGPGEAEFAIAGPAILRGVAETPQHDAVALVLAKLGHAPSGDPLRSLDELLRRDPAAAAPFAAALAPQLARLSKRQAASATLALGSAHLVLGDVALARELLVEAASLAGDDRSIGARAGVRLASAELASGKTSGARLQAGRAFPLVSALGDAELLAELGQVLESAGETIAAAAVPAAQELSVVTRRARTPPRSDDPFPDRRRSWATAAAAIVSPALSRT